MIKSINFWAFEHGLAGTHSIADALAEAEAAGFAGVELCAGEEGTFHINMSQSECESIRNKIESSSIQVQTVASGMSWAFNPTSDDASTRRKSIEVHTAALQRTVWVGAQAMLFVPGVVKSPISPDIVRYDHCKQRAVEAIKTLLEVAENVGVDLCIENVWNGLFYSPLEFAEFVDSFGSDRLGIYFDVGNVLGYHQHPPHWIELLGHRIRRVHIKDFKQSIGSLDGFCDLLAGDVPWPQTMAALRAIGYDRTIVAEMIPWDAGVLKRTSAAMDIILNM